jgi:hypothetical protein
MLKQIFGGSDVAKPRSDSVYAAIVALARQPWLYSQAGVPDTVSGRFDMIVLHLSLLIERLRRTGRSRARPAFSTPAAIWTVTQEMGSASERRQADAHHGRRLHGRAIAYREAFLRLNRRRRLPPCWGATSIPRGRRRRPSSRSSAGMP